jgi:pyridoxamine 5'-phosphate oxidase
MGPTTDQEWQKSEPLSVFSQWMNEAKASPTIREANAMTLSTYCESEGVSSRIVLMKDYSANGFVFYTNYDSEKGRALTANKNATLLFYWEPLLKQVRITGPVTKTSREENLAYWETRPRESQLSQFISRQSEVASSRANLEAKVTAADTLFKDKAVPCPENWGGYVLKPNRFEFWEARPGRLHERFLFVLNQRWTCTRLYP